MTITKTHQVLCPVCGRMQVPTDNECYACGNKLTNLEHVRLSAHKAEVFLIMFVRITGGLDPISAHSTEESAINAMRELGESGDCGGDKHIILHLPVKL